MKRHERKDNKYLKRMVDRWKMNIMFYKLLVSESSDLAQYHNRVYERLAYLLFRVFFTVKWNFLRHYLSLSMKSKQDNEFYEKFSQLFFQLAWNVLSQARQW